MNKYVQNLKVGDEVVINLSEICVLKYAKTKITNISKTGRITVLHDGKKLTFQSNLSGWGNDYFLVNFESECAVNNYKAWAANHA